MCPYIEDITRWQEDMNFMFKWQEQYKILFLPHQNIKFTSSSQCVTFFILYRETNATKAKDRNRDIIERYVTTLTKVTYRKYATQVPDEVAYGVYEWFSSQLNTLLHIIKQYITLHSYIRIIFNFLT